MRGAPRARSRARPWPRTCAASAASRAPPRRAHQPIRLPGIKVPHGMAVPLGTAMPIRMQPCRMTVLRGIPCRRRGIRCGTLSYHRGASTSARRMCLSSRSSARNVSASSCPSVDGRLHEDGMSRQGCLYQDGCFSAHLGQRDIISAHAGMRVGPALSAALPSAAHSPRRTLQAPRLIPSHAARGTLQPVLMWPSPASAAARLAAGATETATADRAATAAAT